MSTLKFKVGDRVQHIYNAARGEPALGTVVSVGQWSSDAYDIVWDEHPAMTPEPHDDSELEAPGGAA